VDAFRRFPFTFDNRLFRNLVFAHMTDSDPQSEAASGALSPLSDRGQMPSDSELPELVESARNRAKEAQTNTARIYRRGWEHFTNFCEGENLRPLPARPEAVGLFIERMASNGYALSTINTRLAAIKKRHEREGERSPTDAPGVQEQWENIQETDDRDPEQKEPLLMEHLRAMSFSAGEEATASLSELRDRAVLFVGFAGGFRRSELVGLETRDLRDADGGIVYRIRNPKGKANTEAIQIPNHVPALNPGPNQALRAWLQAAEIESGPLFRMVDRWGNVRDGALSGYSVNQIVKERIEAVGKDPGDYGAHSLRAGFATQAYMDGIGEHEAAAQTRHSSLETLREYQRVNVVMEDHPLTRMGTGEE
jgi:integrase